MNTGVQIEGIEIAGGYLFHLVCRGMMKLQVRSSKETMYSVFVYNNSLLVVKKVGLT